MSFFYLSGRFAQIGGLIIGLLFGAMWLGAETELPVLSAWAQEFVGADGASDGLLFAAGIGLLTFAVGTGLFAMMGDAENLDRNLRDLRKSGWK